MSTTEGGTGSQAGTTTTTTTPAGAASTQTAADWTSGLNEEQKAFQATKQYESPGALIDAYRNMEKLLGVKDRLLELPADEDPAKWNAVYDRLGRPKEPKEYGFKAGEGEDAKFLEWATGTFHGLGLNKKQAEGLLKKWNEYVGGVTTAQKQELAGMIETDEKALKTEWGLAYQQNEALVDRAAEMLGLKDEQLVKLRETFGYAGAMRFLHSIGSKLGEDSFHAGGDTSGGFSGAMTPMQARAKIGELRKDLEFAKKLSAGDSKTIQEWTKLHEYAAG